MLQMLDDFVDVSKDEKQLMHLWNSFMRKQRCLLVATILIIHFCSFSLIIITSLLARFDMMNEINVLIHVHDYCWFHVFLLW